MQASLLIFMVCKSSNLMQALGSNFTNLCYLSFLLRYASTLLSPPFNAYVPSPFNAYVPLPRPRLLLPVTFPAPPSPTRITCLRLWPTSPSTVFISTCLLPVTPSTTICASVDSKHDLVLRWGLCNTASQSTGVCKPPFRRHYQRLSHFGTTWTTGWMSVGHTTSALIC